MALEHRPAEPQPDPDVLSRLHVMGLTSDDLRDAARAGHEEAVSCTSNDVVGRPNWVRWATPYRILGDKYVPAGWRRERPGGFELLVSPDRTFAVGVAPGDRWTGIERDPVSDEPRMVSTRIDRGPLTGQVTVGNRGQIHFAAADHPAFDDGLLPGTEFGCCCTTGMKIGPKAQTKFGLSCRYPLSSALPAGPRGAASSLSSRRG